MGEREREGVRWGKGEGERDGYLELRSSAHHACTHTGNKTRTHLHDQVASHGQVSLLDAVMECRLARLAVLNVDVCLDFHQLFHDLR